MHWNDWRQNMKQTEMSKYLKLVTIGVGVLLAVLVFRFLPLVLRETMEAAAGKDGYRGVCIFLWTASLPCFLCLWQFWRVCGRIGRDQSFSGENARGMKWMSQYMLADAALFTGFLIWFCAKGWYGEAEWLLFPILLTVFACITLAVLCAALSHLVYKASRMQEDQDLTI